MDLKEKILELKNKRNTIILSHYYQRPEIQDIADAVGDSYYLSKIAKDCRQTVIVFCGVKFMAESAKILSPEKTVLLPANDARCPMADMATAEEVKKLKEKHPNAAVVAYINSTAEVKAVSDVCITSSNAIKIVKSIPNDEIILLPDKNLGSYISKFLPQKKFILWNGFCITHKNVTKESILSVKNIAKDAKILSHPECEEEILQISDFIGSTGEIIDYASNNEYKDYIIVTEEGVLHELKKRNPEKTFYTPSSPMICDNMKKANLETLYNCLLNMEYEVKLDEKLRIKAFSSLMNMHKMAR